MHMADCVLGSGLSTSVYRVPTCHTRTVTQTLIPRITCVLLPCIVHAYIPPTLHFHEATHHDRTISLFLRAYQVIAVSQAGIYIFHNKPLYAELVIPNHSYLKPAR